MADRSGIEWTDATWSPVTGCTRISEGCLNCYIERTPPFRMEGRKFDLPTVGGTTGVRLHPERLDQPLHWRKPRKVFVCSMADLFHDDVPDKFILDVVARMWWAPQHTFQVLTKRPARLRSLAPRIEAHLRQMEGDLALVDCPTPLTWPLPNVWVGVSVESQRWADVRIPLLLDIPAAVRWLSCEPLLGPVDVRPWLHESTCDWTDGVCTCCPPYEVLVDWVVAGGESGKDVLPMHPAWARSLRDQCTAAAAPFLFKQWGEYRPLLVGDYDGARPIRPTHRFSDDETVVRVGKKTAGRVLDGRTWDEYPEAHRG